MKTWLLGRIWNLVYDNDNDAYIPEVWAQEALLQLENNMVAGNLVYRDFENEIKDFGDVVNTRKPAAFQAERKTDGDDVTDQDASAANVAVPLNQWFHTTFVIKDGEMSKSFKNLVDEYLVPAAVSLAQAIDEIVLLQSYQFMGISAGKLGTDPTLATLISLKEALSNAQCPLAGRSLVINPNQEGALLGITTLIEAGKVGDDGTALREGSLGRKLGFNIFMDQNCPSVVSSVAASGAVNYAAGYPAGTTTMTVNGSPTLEAGQWFRVAGDMTPQYVVSVTGSPVTSVTFLPGLRFAVVHTADLYPCPMGAVAQAVSPTGYAAAWPKAIVIDGAPSPAPKKGQLCTFADDATPVIYGLLEGVSATKLRLDRPLDGAIADKDVVGLGPEGSYGFAFHRNALALVTRPLALPPAGTAKASNANHNGISVRVVMTYDGKAQGLRVTLDILAGVKVLDSNLGGVLFS